MAAAPGDLGQRVARRRRELGLSSKEVALRANMAPSYLDHLECSAAVAIPRGSLIRLASALDTTVEALRGGAVSRPPGPGRAGPHPRLDVLTREQCGTYLAPGGVGRVVFLSNGVPLALPANFRYLDGDIVFRTRARGALAAVADAIVSFEVDNIDEAMSEGWSVLVSGHAHVVDDPDELERIAALGIDPWPGGRRDTVIRIQAATVSGRSIHQEDG
jgi:hypothetical protein